MVIAGAELPFHPEYPGNAPIEQGIRNNRGRGRIRRFGQPTRGESGPVPAV